LIVELGKEVLKGAFAFTMAAIIFWAWEKVLVCIIFFVFEH
jgi:hypothetical protein